MDAYGPLNALRDAHEVLERGLELVGESAWEQPSSLQDWSVRDLANHIVGGTVRYDLMINGAGEAELAATRGLDQLGNDALATGQRTNASLLAAFSGPDALTRECYYVLGSKTGLELLVLRVFEAALHGWDLARSVDADLALPDDLCSWMLSQESALDGLRAAGHYQPSTAAASASLQEQLLAAVGRA